MNVLEVIWLYELVKIGIMVISDKCYENKEWFWGYCEIDFMGGYDIYSLSKGCCEFLIFFYWNFYFLVENFF